MILINYLASFFLITLGLYCIVTKHDLLKSVIGLSIMDYGVNLLIISIGFNPGGTAPIYSFGELRPESFFVDPIPQAQLLRGSDPPGAYPDQHRHRRLHHGHEPCPGDQDP